MFSPPYFIHFILGKPHSSSHDVGADWHMIVRIQQSQAQKPVEVPAQSANFPGWGHSDIATVHEMIVGSPKRHTSKNDESVCNDGW